MFCCSFWFLFNLGNGPPVIFIAGPVEGIAAPRTLLSRPAPLPGFVALHHKELTMHLRTGNAMEPWNAVVDTGIYTWKHAATGKLVDSDFPMPPASQSNKGFEVVGSQPRVECSQHQAFFAADLQQALNLECCSVTHSSIHRSDQI